MAGTFLGTRCTPSRWPQRCVGGFPRLRWNPTGPHQCTCPSRPRPRPRPDAGRILVVSAGTSDLPVAEEAAVVAEAFGTPGGAAGRCGRRRPAPAARRGRAAPARRDVVIVVAGMEGALPSVVGGLVAGAGDRGAHERGLRGRLRRPRGPAGDAQLLRGGGDRGQYRQRLRRRSRGQPDLRPMTVRTVLERARTRLRLDRRGASARAEELTEHRRSGTASTPSSVNDCLDPEHLPKFEGSRATRSSSFAPATRPPSAAGVTVQDLTRKVAIFFSPRFLITIHRKDAGLARGDRARVGRRSGRARRTGTGFSRLLIADLQCGGRHLSRRRWSGSRAGIDAFEIELVSAAAWSPARRSAASCTRSTFSSAR